MSAAATAEFFEVERPRLFGLAYRMLGSVSDADDIVQDAWLRFDAATDVDRPAAFLTTVTTRLAIDRLRSAQRRREAYVGPWLPEPVLTDRDPAHIVEVDDTVTLGFLHVLEHLSPVDRAVFLLHDVFDVGYAEIAELLDKTETACRQIATRARQRIHGERPTFHVDPARRRELLDTFIEATLSGDPVRLQALLAEDVVLTSDGGPNRHAARKPVVGVDRVSRFIANIVKRLGAGTPIELVEANGQLAILVIQDDEPSILTEVEFDGDKLRRVNIVLNPDKLAAVRAAWR